MLGMIDSFRNIFEEKGIELSTPNVVQTLSVEELKEIVPKHDGWIIGDDPATREVFEAGKLGDLKAAVKWGIGVDNVDFTACKDLEIPIINTPDMFGTEVSDIALGYVIALARETFEIDRAVRAGEWPKPRGISLSNKVVALIGYGDVGKNTAKRLLAADMKVIAYDPAISQLQSSSSIEFSKWPHRLDEADYILVTCALTPSSRHMINSESIAMTKQGVRIVNVGRGPIIDENALIAALQSGHVYSAALDVFETEPLNTNHEILNHPKCILGSHNASNTVDAVERASIEAISKLYEMLKSQR